MRNPKTDILSSFTVDLARWGCQKLGSGRPLSWQIERRRGEKTLLYIHQYR
jgi:hypothetical protein